MSSAATSLPRIVLVLGKGGVGRSTLAAALGLSRARRGERVLVLEWTVAEPIGPWFGLAPVGVAPIEVTPGLSVANYDLDEALRAYFVDHLRMPSFYRRVLGNASMRRLIDAAPGISELLFLGQLWWLTTLAAEEAGLCFDRIVVDAPATGHGAALLDLPATLASMGAAGLLSMEIGRVVDMMGDASWTGTVVVTLAEELGVEETRELVPRATRGLGRPPLCAFVNRSTRALVDAEGGRPDALDSVLSRLPPDDRAALVTLHHDLTGRAVRERELVHTLAGVTGGGVVSLPEQLALLGDCSPRVVVEALAGTLEPVFGGPP